MWVKSLLNAARTIHKRSIYNFARGGGGSRKQKSLYDILGVTPDASQSQIKKAYYKLAQTHHPDINHEPGAKDKFTEINNAYEILSDQKKKQFYNQTGSSDGNAYQENEEMYNNFGGMGSMGNMGGINMDDMGKFQSVFEDLFGFSGGRGEKKKQNGPQKLVTRMEIDFNEAVNGVKKTIKIQRKCLCSTCKGSKAKPGTQPQKCHSCHGQGFMSMRHGPMVLQSMCESCNGQGKRIVHHCTTCKGKGVEVKQSNEQITIPKGIQNDSIMKLKNKGHLNGDLQIKISVKKNKKFQRSGLQALSKQQISIIDAVLGCQLNIKTIYGEQKKIIVQPGTQSGDQIKINKQGFFKINSSTKGNHVITIKVKIPNKISTEQRLLYEQLKKLKQAEINKAQATQPK